MSIQTDPRRINVIAKLAFAPIYPYLAQQIKDKFGFTEGICVDIGSGPGSLAIATARITNLTLFSVDIQPEMASIARDNIAEAGLSSRIHTITADVCRLPFEDSSVDLVISRGSIFFWEDRVAAFHEIYRILKRGGVAYCGNGMGNEEIKTQVIAAFSTNEVLKVEKEAWQEMVGHISQKLNPEGLQAELAWAQVPGTVVRENGGLWVQIIKKLRQD